VVIGAGAIGVTLAAELQRAGNSVVLVARGAQLQAAREVGITYARPDGARILTVPVAGRPDEVALGEGDVLLLATKTQDAGEAIAIWAQQPTTLADGSVSTAGATLPLLTTQNGLETERLALRHFKTVFGGVLLLPATYVKPGVIVAPGAPAVGIAYIGAYPDREHPRIESIARELRRAAIETTAVSDISRWKQAKLVAAGTFVLDALYLATPLRDRAAALLREEAHDVLAAAGMQPADLRPPGANSQTKLEIREVAGYEYGGTSTWQSLSRAGSLETDYINGEIVLLARAAYRTAPAHEAVTARIHAAAREGLSPRALDDHDLLATFPQLAEAQPPQDDVLVSPLWLQQRLRETNPPAVLDVRWDLRDPNGRGHYADGHIPNAVYVDLDSELASPPSANAGRHPLPEIDALQRSAQAWGLRDGQAVVVYDDNGGMSAARAWWLLRWAGVEDVRILDGSFSAWTRAGLSVEIGERAVEPGDVELEGGHLPVLDAEQAAELAHTGVLLDARAHERYSGDHEPVDPRAGHVPGAISAPTSENLAADGRFLAADALHERFASLGVDDGSQIGVYCGSGVTAAHQIAALQIVGIDAALFPGSWSAWSSDPDRPVVIGTHP
jgi:thiosulfate/3-mercaptopyruvate sulfurtransferase